MMDDATFKKIDKHSKALLALVEEDENLSMMLHIGQAIDEENINSYSVVIGNSVLISNSLYVDLRGQIEAGNPNLFLELEEMLQHLREEMEDEGIAIEDNDTDLAPTTLH